MEMCEADPLLFSDRKRQTKPRSRTHKYSMTTEYRGESPGEDERVERSVVEAKYRAPTERKKSTPTVAKARARSFHWGETSGGTNILASFPFHSSSFHKDNNDTARDLDNVYDYEIDAGKINQYHYVPKESNQRNASANSSRQTSPGGDVEEAFDRPPSRQRHAFPTHLVDHDLDDDDGARQSVAVKRAHRPPSRHKPRTSDPASFSCEINEQSLEDTINRFRTRRGALRQSHDPHRDGFEAVDETLPLPFRIEVTNEDGVWKAPTATGPRHRRGRPRQQPSAATPSTDELRKALQSRAEDPMILKSTPDRRRHARTSASHAPAKDEPVARLHHPSAQWIPVSLQVDARPETNDTPQKRAEIASDLQLDDFNFSAPPDTSLNTTF
ncbi:hypothetical protein ACHHYP_00899 [Achlya hypogyna]|uniref:Uncharacterized protein n=1 Tax=Achlya hypogyna TaxID=1202772 RepID=A0A1V9ZAF1_ACHHY|nr:hypothetical protein ACHHYP_00899 [Achlya hypogyna]